MSNTIESITGVNHINFIYKQTCDEINQTKHRQWQITYYCLILNILILFVFKYLKPAKITFEDIFLVCLSIGITTIGIIYIIFTQKNLVNCHFRLIRIHKNLPEDKYLILEKPSLKFTSFTFHIYHIIIPFILVLILTSMIVSYLILV